MIENLLGIEQLPLPVKLIVAFVIVLVLIALATWVVRRLGGNRLGAPSARGRQPRLAVIDAAAVDGRRRLVLIRRDNVEHLLMIGGPSDLVVEQNIVRAVPVAQPREAQPQRAPGEPVPRPAGEPRGAPSSERPRVPRPEPAARAEAAARGGRPEPTRVAPLETPRPRPMPAKTDAEPASVEMHAAPPTADTNLADMAHKLEAALRRPSVPRRAEPSAAEAGLPEPAPRTAPESETSGAPRGPGASGAPQPGAAPEAKTSPAPAPAKSVFDSLEEEMASLLVKPPSKP